MRILKDELALAPSRVARGVALLDQRDPGWWREAHPRKIELATLDMASGCRCVVGQRHGGVYSPDLDGAKGFVGGTDCGFDVPPAYSFDVDESDARKAYYGALQAEWVRVITERRGAEVQLT